MEHKYCAESDSILIRPLEKTDLEYFRCWRNDSELSTFLRSIPYISSEAQMKWFEDYLEDNNALFFAVIDKKRKVTVGSAALYDFNGESCKVGKIIIGDPSSHGKGIGYRSLLLAITVVIQKLGINRIGLDVHKDNIPARRIYEKAGFKVIGEHAFEKGGFEIEMGIYSIQFYKVNSIAATIKVFMKNEMTSFSFANRGRLSENSKVRFKSGGQCSIYEQI